jgi:hypothetical protein
MQKSYVVNITRLACKKPCIFFGTKWGRQYVFDTMFSHVFVGICCDPGTGKQQELHQEHSAKRNRFFSGTGISSKKDIYKMKEGFKPIKQEFGENYETRSIGLVVHAWEHEHVLKSNAPSYPLAMTGIPSASLILRILSQSQCPSWCDWLAMRPCTVSREQPAS